MDFSSIDDKVQFIESSQPKILSQLLTAPYKTNLEKTRSIFRWITEHISYRVRGYESRKAALSARYVVSDDDGDDSSDLKPLDERVADIVLKKRSGLCDGYARLFKTLCEYAGIPCEVITGYARNDMDQHVKRFGCNHSWNAVFIDSAWHLLDVTWASGFISWGGNEFIRHFNEQYFMTLPEDFIQDHYPDDLRWVLLSAPDLPSEFKRSPYKQKSFIKYKITSYSPSGGVIEASIGDTLNFELQTASSSYDHQIVPDLFFDSTHFFPNSTKAFLDPVISGEDSHDANNISYSYVVNSPSVDWLFIKYNDDVILRYKLNVRK
ncbi:MAG TPA: transglutaminase domain-containing protein [Chitinophagaceae bacterium]|nr:transglutaminase domain-containing protein [Chitinophagaceae bacterium]